jgi:hypothetical protein
MEEMIISRAQGAHANKAPDTGHCVIYITVTQNTVKHFLLSHGVDFILLRPPELV